MSFDCCVTVPGNHCYGRLDGFLNKEGCQMQQKEKKVPMM